MAHLTTLQEAYDQGFDAYLNDQQNPYVVGTFHWDAWELGWGDGWLQWNDGGQG